MSGGLAIVTPSRLEKGEIGRELYLNYNIVMSLGIRHIEILVSDLDNSIEFYSKLFSLVGWKQFDETSFKFGDTKIYFKKSTLSKRDLEGKQRDMLGPRHMCFNASDRDMVNIVGKFLKERNNKIIRGPLEVFDNRNPHGGYYTVDFYDPDGYILEVAYVNHFKNPTPP